MRIKAKDRLSKLRVLVDSLNDRDEEMKRNMQMFDRFFDNFPIPVTMWTIAKDGAVISQRGNGIVHEHADSVDALFECPILSGMAHEAHELAFAGEHKSFLARTEDNFYYVSIVPYVVDDKVSSVSGIAWDVTSNAFMLAILETISELTEQRSGDYKNINELAHKALKASRLAYLIREESPDE
jgi:hypothetical protein